MFFLPSLFVFSIFIITVLKSLSANAIISVILGLFLLTDFLLVVVHIFHFLVCLLIFYYMVDIPNMFEYLDFLKMKRWPFSWMIFKLLNCVNIFSS